MMKEGWVRKKIKDICDKASSNIVQNKVMDNNGDYPLYGASGFVKCLDFYHRDEPYIGIVKDGSGVGRVNVYPAYSSLVGTMQYVIPKNGFLLGYIKYVLQSLNLAHFASGAAIPHIYFKDYGECTVLIPPLSEQESIVAELDKLNEILAKKQEQLKELDRLGLAIFYDMFGDPIFNEKNWEKKQIRHIGKVITGNTPSRNNKFFYTPCYLEWIKSDNIKNGELYPSEAKEYLSLEGVKKGRVVNANSLLITCIAGSLSSIGSACLTNRVVAFNQQINAIEPFQNINSLFLLYLMKFSQKYIQEQATNGMKHIITKSNFEQLLLSVPPFEFQNEFMEKIKFVEFQKQKIKQSIVDVQQLLDYTMNKYFG